MVFLALCCGWPVGSRAAAVVGRAVGGRGGRFGVVQALMLGGSCHGIWTMISAAACNSPVHQVSDLDSLILHQQSVQPPSASRGGRSSADAVDIHIVNGPRHLSMRRARTVPIQRRGLGVPWGILAMGTDGWGGLFSPSGHVVDDWS